jgi:hypothetical protein
MADNVELAEKMILATMLLNAERSCNWDVPALLRAGGNALKLTELENIELRAEIKVIKKDRYRLLSGLRNVAASRNFSESTQQLHLLDALLRGEDITEEVG